MFTKGAAIYLKDLNNPLSVTVGNIMFMGTRGNIVCCNSVIAGDEASWKDGELACNCLWK